MAAEWASAESLEQLVREHESLVAATHSERWQAELRRAGFSAVALAAARSSPEWDGLVRVLARAEDRGLPVRAAHGRLVELVPAGTGLAGTMRAALSGWEARTDGSQPRTRELVAGLIPRVRAIEDDDLAKAVRQREGMITRRARELAEQAVQSGKEWAKPFGPAPKDPGVAEAWWGRLAVIAAYRDHWHVAGPGILGDRAGTQSLQQAAHRERARRAGQEAAVLTGVIAPRPPAPSPSSTLGIRGEPGVDL